MEHLAHRLGRVVLVLPYCNATFATLLCLQQIVAGLVLVAEIAREHHLIGLRFVVRALQLFDVCIHLCISALAVHFCLQLSCLGQPFHKWLDGIIQQIECADLDVVPHRVCSIGQRLECLTQASHGVFELYVGLSCAVGCGFDVVAGLAHLLADDFAHGLGHVASLLHLVADFGG